MYCAVFRAAFQTGRLSVRSGMTANILRVLLSPDQTGGLPLTEITIAEALKTAGYSTGNVCVYGCMYVCMYVCVCVCVCVW